MSDLQLLVLAAGMGSRFGGMKQSHPVDAEGCFIIDYSIFDALNAGIKDVVIVIKKENEDDFRNTVGARVEKKVKITYAYQELDDLPAGFSLPPNRTKPWGTGHAVLSARGKIDKPFIIVNADDYYGRNSYVHMARAARNLNVGEAALAGYKLCDCLSEKGTVSRGICRTKGLELEYIEEHLELKKEGAYVAGINEAGTRVTLSPNSYASLNMFAFHPSIFKDFYSGFESFLRNLPPEKSDSAEFYLPSQVQNGIGNGSLKTTIIPVDSRWHGITYKDDLQSLMDAIENYKKSKIYPERLW